MGRRRTGELISKDLILRSATREFIEQGFHGARMDRIARAGKFNKAMIYYHFRSKQAIYEEVLRSVVTKVFTALNAHSEDPASVEELLGGIYDTYQRMTTEFPDYIKLTVYELVRGAPTLKRMRILKWSDIPFNPVNGRIYKYLKARMEDGTIRKMDIFQLIVTILGQVVPVIVLSFMKDIVKDFRLVFNPTTLIDNTLKARRAFVIETTMRAIAPDKGEPK